MEGSDRKIESERAEWQRRIVEEENAAVWRSSTGVQTAEALFGEFELTGSDVLIIGEGSNPMFRNYVDTHGDSVTVYSVDWLTSALREARDEANTTEGASVCADAAFLPFSDDEFDAVVPLDGVTSGLHEHNERILAECRRVLRPGGRFAGLFPSVFCPLELSELHPDNPMTDEIRIDIAESLFVDGDDGLPRRFYTPLRLNAMLDSADLQRESFEILILDEPAFVAEAERVYDVPSESELYIWLLLVTATFSAGER